ncbi:methionine ABC transporter ATP-binding protein [Lysinibacillus sp. NPDC093190]|uniref:methionine ABC transporter ATP-binding protein n=1 Tax=Lysinibacillus sp. NPDC093190 TaxID=3390575 RepID=UPI003CFBD029
MIVFKHIVKEFYQKKKKIVALNEVSLEVQKGDIFGIIGYSGAGKSTLIRMVNGLENPTSGQIIVDGKDIQKLSPNEKILNKKKISMIFQHFNLLESKNVFDNVALPLKLRNESKEDIDRKVKEMLSFVGLEDKEKNYPSQLSGGQKQRVGIARALVTNPEILLCDEATSALDPKTTKSILALLKRVNEQFNITILLITHEMEVIRDLCNKVAVMENGQLVETGNVIQVFGQPNQQTTKDFVETVIPNKIPKDLLDFYQKNQQTYTLLRLKFLGENTASSLLYQLNKRFNLVESNIVLANVTELEGTTLGIFTIAFSANEPIIQEIKAFIKEFNVIVEDVKI